MGIEPTTDIVCPPLDLKSRRPTRTYPLPNLNLKDFIFKVNPFDKTTVLPRVDPENPRRGQDVWNLLRTFPLTKEAKIPPKQRTVKRVKAIFVHFRKAG